MKLLLILHGRTTDKHLQALIDDYAARLTHYVPFAVEVIPELRQTKALTTEQQRAAEAALLRARLQPGDHLVLLDEHGSERRSVDFARWMERRLAAGGRRLVLVVGGPYGFDPAIHAMAAEEVSMSLMTFSHQLIRLLVVEQLYRAFTIMRGEPYHHE